MNLIQFVAGVILPDFVVFRVTATGFRTPTGRQMFGQIRGDFHTDRFGQNQHGLFRCLSDFQPEYSQKVGNAGSMQRNMQLAAMLRGQVGAGLQYPAFSGEGLCNADLAAIGRH